MTINIPLKSIQLAPGSSVTIDNLTWQDFETILIELGERDEYASPTFKAP